MRTKPRGAWIALVDRDDGYDDEYIVYNTSTRWAVNTFLDDAAFTVYLPRTEKERRRAVATIIRALNRAKIVVRQVKT